MSRLTIELQPEQHRQIKTLATFAGMSIKDFILAKTLHSFSNAQGDSTDQLLASPKNAARLKEALATPASEHVVFASIEELNHALGI